VVGRAPGLNPRTMALSERFAVTGA
jgi:hypothetical protein